MQSKKVIMLEEGWNTIHSEAITRLQKLLDGTWKEPLLFANNEYMTLYTTVYDMCTQKAPNNWAAPLYNRYSQAFKDYLLQVLQSMGHKYGDPLLRDFVSRWENHKLMVRWMVKFFTYLDRFYVKRVSVPSLNEVGVNCFIETIFDSVKVQVRKEVLSLIEKERDGETIDRDLLKKVLQIFVELGQDSLVRYEQEFEDQFLAQSSEHYSRQSALWIGVDSCPEYMTKVEKRLTEEVQRAKNYCHPSTEDKVLQVCEHQLLSVHQQDLLFKENSGVDALLRDHKADELSRMYRLYSRITSGLNPIADRVKHHITEAGMALYMQQEPESSKSSYIQDLLDMHDKYHNLVVTCFQDSQLFHKALKDAFEVFVNKDIGKTQTAELLSTFCDQILKKSGEKMSELEVEETLERLVRLFSFLSDKDVFAEFYRKQLAKRLLLSRSASDDAERSFIQKLKFRCGSQFTSKLEGMVTDMTTSVDQQRFFTEYLSTSEISLGLDCSVTVLTTGFWPPYKADELTLPPVLANCIQTFTQFYDKRTSHRKLRWVHQLGTATLVGHFKAKKIELILSTYQACILLLFNEHQSLTTSDLLPIINLPREELARYMATLTGTEAGPKYKVLLKNPPEKEILDTDVFSFNEDFNDRTRKIKMTLLVTKVSQEEKQATRQTVDEDRKHAVEAAIVRVMKSRKSLDHQHLTLEVSEQLMAHFKPDPKVIKKRIEDLIAREYIERDSNKPNIFHYLA